MTKTIDGKTYVADLTPDNLRLAQTLGERLTAELMRPGRFELGQVVATIGAHNTLAAAFHATSPVPASAARISAPV